MRTLSSTLLAVQKQPSSVPYVRVTAANKVAGVVRYDWSRLYTGVEDDYYHGLTIPADGSLIRVRVTPPADNRKLYRQRVADPGPASDFSQWTYTGQYNAAAVATASLGAEVSIFWTDMLNRKIQRLKSVDCGATWGSPELIDYSPSTSINGLAAAYKPNGDLVIFFADQSTLYVKKLISGEWQTKAAWDKSTGDLSGVAAVYSDDWHLLVTGKDSSGNFKLWSLIYGDGDDVPAGSWSELKELASAPSDGDFAYAQPFLAKPDVHRCFYVEKFSGNEAYSRPFWSHLVLNSAFRDNLWREPVPFDLSTEYGLAIAHHGDYCWLSSPSSVWRADMSLKTLELTADIISLRQEAGETSGELKVELRNDDGKYAQPGEGSLSILTPGCQLEFSPGYRTSVGNEVSAGQAYCIEAHEHVSSGGKSCLVLHGLDGWHALRRWRAAHQFRWNKSSDELRVKDIIAFVLGRIGVRLTALSQSSTAAGFYPDFTINAGDGGETIIRKLLSFVPDVIFLEGQNAYLVNPLPSDGSVYSYGVSHSIIEGNYKKGVWEVNHLLIEGYDRGDGKPIITERFAWDEINRVCGRLRQLDDRNLGTVAEARQRGDAYLRRAEMASAGGYLLVPVNCGQQLYDVIDITDSRAGLSGAKRRVLGFSLRYNPQHAEYHQHLYLGAV